MKIIRKKSLVVIFKFQFLMLCCDGRSFLVLNRINKIGQI